jgi:hypothetical protein
VRLSTTAVAVTAALILVAINIFAGLGDLPSRVMNVACVLSFTFFTYTVLPKSLLGFALTLSDWGDILRREMHGIDVPTAAEFRRAAARSLVVLTGVLILGIFGAFSRRHADMREFLQSMAVLTGAEAGFVIGYLVIVRRRNDR